MEFFYRKRVLCHPRELLRPLRREPYRRNYYPPSVAAVPRRLVATVGEEAGDGDTYSRRPCQPRSEWRRPGIRYGDGDAAVVDPPDGCICRWQSDEAKPLHREARSSPRDMEEKHKLNLDHITKFIDLMKMKMTGNESGGNCCMEETADGETERRPADPGSPGKWKYSESSLATSDADTLSTSASEEPPRSIPPAPCDDEFSATDVDDYRGHVSIPLEDGSFTAANISDTAIVAQKSLSDETTCSGHVTSTTAEPFHSSQLKPANYDEFTNGIGRGRVRSVQTSTAAMSPSHYRMFAGDTQLHGSQNGVHASRLLSADASCYLWQESGDVVVESSSEEDLHDYEDWD